MVISIQQKVLVGELQFLFLLKRKCLKENTSDMSPLQNDEKGDFFVLQK